VFLKPKIKRNEMEKQIELLAQNIAHERNFKKGNDLVRNKQKCVISQTK